MAAAHVVSNLHQTQRHDVDASTTELLQKMVNEALKTSKKKIKREPYEDKGRMDKTDISKLPVLQTIAKDRHLLLKASSSKSSPLVSTSGIAKIPAEPVAKSINSDADTTKPSTSSFGIYMKVQEPKTRVFLDTASNVLSISHNSSTLVHSGTTVTVPRSEELRPLSQRLAETPASSPTDKRGSHSMTNLSSWLSEHFGQQLATTSVESAKVPCPKSSVLTSSSVSLKDLPAKQLKASPKASLLPWLLQFAIRTPSSGSSNLISGGRTVEIPLNEFDDQQPTMPSRKIQRLPGTTKKLPTLRDAVRSTSSSQQQYKELRIEIRKMRKQMLRDRIRFLDECRAMRRDFKTLQETIFTVSKRIVARDKQVGEDGYYKPSSDLHEVDKLPGDDIEEPVIKRRC